MSDWSAGYVSDIDYTYGYYDDLNPERIKLAFLRAGLLYPKIETACELGFGQGVSINIHAAASGAQWSGTDFNPAQAGFARELAQASGVSALLQDEGFEEFCQRDDLPEFDYIGLHGIWSWISDHNRQVLVDFIGRKLKVGGVMYISYNTLPGWSGFVPLRNLMADHTRLMGQQGAGITGRISDAVDFAQKMLEVDPIFARANPLTGDRLKRMAGQAPEYLAHEYFNQDWHPMDFARMCEWLEPAKVSFACSATYSEHVSGLSLTQQQAAFLETIPNHQLRESTRDLMVNQQFRRDYWVKGRRELSPLEKAETLRAQRVALVGRAEDFEYKVKGTLGEIAVNEDIYRPVLDALADHTIKTVAELEVLVKPAGVTFSQLFESIMVLTSAGQVAPVQSHDAIEAARPSTTRLNRHLCMQARSRSGLNHLASPLTGGGCVVSRFEKIFMLGMEEGLSTTEELAQYAWKLLASQGQSLTKEGKTLQTAEENLAELRANADTFLNQRVPLLKVMMVM